MVNTLLYIDNKPLKEEFDGHVNRFIETGNNKALPIDFNCQQEPVEGAFPIARIGPLKLLKESVFDHWKVIDYLQEKHNKDEALSVRGIKKSCIVNIKEFYALF